MEMIYSYSPTGFKVRYFDTRDNEEYFSEADMKTLQISLGYRF